MPEAASCQFIFLSEKKAWNNLQLSCICQDVHWIFQYFAQISPAAEFASEILILNHPIFIFCSKWSISQVNSHTTTLSVLDVMFLVSCSWLVSGGGYIALCCSKKYVNWNYDHRKKSLGPKVLVSSHKKRC